MGVKSYSSLISPSSNPGQKSLHCFSKVQVLRKMPHTFFKAIPSISNIRHALYSDIGLLNLGIIQKVLCSPFHHDGTIFQDIGPVR
jgi:hypothetical protein